MNKTFIIAEIGVNHNGNLDLAYKLVDAAILAGADAVKFQTAIPELVATNYAQKADYQKKKSKLGESQLEMIRKIHFPIKTYELIKTYCNDKKTIFLSSAFDLISLDYLENLGLLYHKIPSGEITNLPFLKQIGKYNKPIILSTGMATLGEIEIAIQVLEQAGTTRKKITVLHCTSEYPAPMAEVNLRAMQSISKAFGVAVGYSDHTPGIEVAIASVAMGASIIEKHFTLDHDFSGPDHRASLEPAEFKMMVSAIRNIEIALGDGIKCPTFGEIKNKLLVRKSLVAGRLIKAGEIFTTENLTSKRPGTGISPMHLDEVVGKKAPHDFLEDELIKL